MSHEESVRKWGGARDAFEVVSVDSKSPDSWRARLTTTERSGVRGLGLELREADGWVTLSIEEPLPPDLMDLAGRDKSAQQDLASMVATVQESRPGGVACELRDNARVEISVSLHSEGFTRLQLNSAVLELGRTLRALEQRSNTMVATAQMLAESNAEFEAQAAEMRRILGESERELQQARAEAPAVPEPQAKPCPKCGAATVAGSKFCSQCGSPLQA